MVATLRGRAWECKRKAGNAQLLAAESAGQGLQVLGGVLGRSAQARGVGAAQAMTGAARLTGGWVGAGSRCAAVPHPLPERRVCGYLVTCSPVSGLRGVNITAGAVTNTFIMGAVTNTMVIVPVGNVWVIRSLTTNP